MVHSVARFVPNNQPHIRTLMKKIIRSARNLSVTALCVIGCISSLILSIYLLNRATLPDSAAVRDLHEAALSGRALAIVDPVDAPFLPGESGEKVWAVDIDGQKFTRFTAEFSAVIEAGHYSVVFEPNPRRFRANAFVENGFQSTLTSGQ
jgi:hypothetical protein